MAQLFVGTSGWAYSSWKPDFYPAKLAQKKFLGHYAAQLNTVEVNFTFRQLVKETTVQNWLQETPAHFRFGIKAHQVITHIKRAEGHGGFSFRAFWRRLSRWPPQGSWGRSYSSSLPNLKADAALLNDFLALLPKSLPAAFEFRNESWFSDSTWDALQSRGVSLCVAETEERTTPDVVTGPFVYYRFRKPGYSSDERTSMMARIAEHMSAARDVFAYFKHEETPEGALLALDLLRGGGK